MNPDTPSVEQVERIVGEFPGESSRLPRVVRILVGLLKVTLSTILVIAALVCGIGLLAVATLAPVIAAVWLWQHLLVVIG